MKRLIRGIIFLTLIIIAVYVLNRIYCWKSTDYIDNWSDSSTVADFYNEPKDSLDVLIFGTSTASMGVQPALLWNQQKITSYNMSTEQQYSIVAYYLLTESLKYQHPRVVIINAKWVTTKYDLDKPNNFFDEDNTDAVVHLSLDYMKFSDTKIQAASDIASHSYTRSALGYIFPFILFHSRDDITSKDFDESFLSKQHVLKGSSIYLDTNEITLDYQKENKESTEAASKYDFSGISPAYVKKIIEMCNAKGIKVLLLSMPIPDWDREKHMEVQTFADAYGASYLDINDENAKKTIIDPKTDFANGAHVNVFGSYKTSSCVASYLASNYTFEHNYSEEVSAAFDKSYADFMSYYIAYQSELISKNSIKS